MTGGASSRWRRALEWIRDAWLITGLTLLAFLALEGGYRGMAALRQRGAGRSAGPRPQVPHPNAGFDWWTEYRRALQSGIPRRFDPFRLVWPTGFRSRYVNIDSLGRRVTPQIRPDSVAGRVIVLGGSTAWGVAARDSFTIPARMAWWLRADGVSDVIVENYGHHAFRTTQELTTLLLELARGPIPTAVVFLDGYNDATLALRLNEVGRANGDDDLRALVSRGGRGFWGELGGLFRYSRMVARLQQMAAPAPPPRPPTDLAICDQNAAYYRRMADLVDGLGARLGFRAWFFQQPLHFLVDKPMTPWEQNMLSTAIQSPDDLRRCMLAMDAAMRGHSNYRSLSSLFDGDTAAVFVDVHGHLTERANDRVARCIAAVLAPTLHPRRPADPAETCTPSTDTGHPIARPRRQSLVTPRGP